MSIAQVQTEIVEEFSSFDDWMDRYAYLIEIGNALQPYPEAHRLEQNLIEGCQSRVWLNAELIDGKIHYQGDSDAIIVKGIVGLLVRALSGYTPSEILDAELFFVDQIGLKEHLSPSRSNGLVAMMRQMRLFALAFKARQEQL